MINSIEINNFQSHKKTKLDFVKGINTIIGKSDSGKSAMARALRYAIFNKPPSTYRSDWGGKTSVNIKIDNHLIKRIKTDSKNLYFLNEKEFKAFGKSGIPEEIQDAINMTELNLQRQLDEHFMLSKSSGENAKYLNKVIDLEIIDESLSKADSKCRNLKSDINYLEVDLENEKKRIESYDFVELAEKDFFAVIEKEQKLDEKKEKSSNLCVFLDNFNVNEKKKADFDIKEAAQKINNIESKLKNLEVEKKNLKDMKEFISDYYDNEENKSEINFKQAEKLLSDIESKEKDLEKKKEKEQELNLLSSKIFTNKDLLEGIKQKIKKYEKELIEIMPEICPLCEQEIK